MAKVCERLSESEFMKLPMALSRHEAAAALGINARYLGYHPDEFGGQKIAGRWLFPKRTIAAILGIEL